MPKKLTYDYIKSHIESKGYQLLSKEYYGIHNKLVILCPKNHQFKITYNCFKNGRGCPECFNKKRGNYNRLSIEKIKYIIESEGYKLLSKEYQNNRKKLSVQCPSGHEFEMSYGAFQRGSRCSVCYYESASSKPEREIQEFVSQIYNGEIINNDRNTIINPETGYNLELDIYLPEINKAIEFNGLYWHSNNYQINKDRIKVNQCINKSIDLLIIQDKLYKFDKERCLNNIQKFIYN